MVLTDEVREEVIVRIDHGPGFCNERTLVLVGDLSEPAIIKFVAEICGRQIRTSQGKVHPQASFEASKRLTGEAHGKTLHSDPELFIPQSHFGEARELTVQERKRFKSFEYAATTIAGETKMLAPGDRVYGLDGTLKFTTPAITG